MTTRLKRLSTQSEYDTAELMLNATEFKISGKIVLTPKQWKRLCTREGTTSIKSKAPFNISEGPPEGETEIEPTKETSDDWFSYLIVGGVIFCAGMLFGKK